MGGASLRHGGAATAALLAAGRRAQAMREAAQFGLGAVAPQSNARFTGRREVAAAGVAIRARCFVIATGPRPRMPRIAGLDRVPLLKPETFFANDTLPEHLSVLVGAR